MSKIKSATAALGHLDIVWANGSTSMFHYIWLRDNCPQMRHPQTNHRVEETSLIPPDIAPIKIEILHSGDLEITWPDEHVSVYDPAFLGLHDYSNGLRHIKPKPILWDGTFASSIPRMTYEQLFQDTTARINWIRAFRDYGLAIMTNVPNEDGAVAVVGDELGQVRMTSWGRVSNVKSIAQANSLAYTNMGLHLHCDEGYRDPAPSVQLQHFLVNEAVGGEATLVDGFKVASDLRRLDPDSFKLLCDTELYFTLGDADVYLQNYGPLIELDSVGEIKRIRYSNHSVQPFLMEHSKMEAFYRAYAVMGSMRKDPKYFIQVAMGAGEMYMVNNWRVMHGRTGFAAGGVRHLQTCYIEQDELYGRLAFLERLLTSSR